MHRWKTALTFVVTACWLLAASHCQLEKLPGFSFLACESAEADGHPANDCKTDACCEMEGALYKTSNPRIAPAPAAPVMHCLTELASDLQSTADLAVVPSPSVAPPELPAAWRFAWRAALPPRAPSFAA